MAYLTGVTRIAGYLKPSRTTALAVVVGGGACCLFMRVCLRQMRPSDPARTVWVSSTTGKDLVRVAPLWEAPFAPGLPLRVNRQFC
jgi:hypothetical protein